MNIKVDKRIRTIYFMDFDCCKEAIHIFFYLIKVTREVNLKRGKGKTGKPVSINCYHWAKENELYFFFNARGEF